MNWRRLLDTLAGTSDSPRRTAAAFALVAPFFWSFLAGSTVGAMVVGIATYFAKTALDADDDR